MEKHPKLGSILGLVTARGGSVGLPGKNIMDLGGKPVVAWTIEAAVRSKYLDRVVLSTDNEQIAEAGLTHGAEVPFIRPAELAESDTPHLNVITHALSSLSSAEYDASWVMVLQPTSPMRTSEDIDAAIEIAATSDCEAVISVTRARQHPMLCSRLSASGMMSPFIAGSPLPGSRGIRRQDLPAAWFANGAIYLVSVRELFWQMTLAPRKTAAYIMPPERSFQIDDITDFKVIEALVRSKETV